MFLQLFSIEWTRLTRRVLPWLMLAACAAYTWLSLQNFYTTNHSQFLDGSVKMPGVSFDLANSLNQLLMLDLFFLVAIAALVLGSDYSERTNRHWLMRASRSSCLLAKFAMLALVIFLVQIAVLLVGGLTGWYYKSITLDMFSAANVNWPAVFSSALYMTLVRLPYAALMLLIVVVTRSTFAGIAIGLGYTQFVEVALASAFYGKEWSRWLIRNLHESATYLLNSIGNKVVEIPTFLLTPAQAMAAASVYTAAFLGLAIMLSLRQDVGG
jgi:hypothetical protein